MNFQDATIYHIYPLGFCGQLQPNDFVSQPVNRIKKVIEFIPHLVELGINTIYFGPVFESTKHGYDTADYLKIDRRLGTNEDFAQVCKELHKNGIKVVLDGVFNHVGRNFWAFEEVKSKRHYLDWFNINEGGNSNYNDGFYYEGWEGHFDLVKLNLNNKAVRDHLIEAVGKWIDEFEIDGIRLDVAYCLNEDFMRELRSFTDNKKESFWLMGEMLHGDYNRIMNDQMLHSVTNYECYKGLYSSINSKNFFEIAHSLNRQFGLENWCLYTGKLLACFLDNHDVSRIATILEDKQNLALAYTLLFSMPGIPMIYYGGEWGIEGDKSKGDDDLRKEAVLLEDTELTKHIKKLCEIRKNSKPLQTGSYSSMVLQNKYYSILRSCDGEDVICAFNIDDNPVEITTNGLNGVDLISGENVCGTIKLQPHQSAIVKVVR